MPGHARDNSRLDRTSEIAARQIIERLLPAAESRRAVLSFLADSIVQAHGCSTVSWGVTLFKNVVRLNAGPIEIFALNQNGIYIVVNSAALTAKTRSALERRGEFGAQDHYRSIPNAVGIQFSPEVFPLVAQSLREAHHALIAEAATTERRSTWYEAHSPGVIDYLQHTLGRHIPNPGYVEEIRHLGDFQERNSVGVANVPDILRHSCASAGLQYSTWQLASFYTALQVKGFAILSGISGTGKTRLAQHFASLLPQPATASGTGDGAITLTVLPYMLKYGRLIIPKQAARLFEPPQPGQTREVVLSFNAQSQTCRLMHAAYADNDYIQLLLRGAARQWLNKNLAVGDTLLLEPEIDEDQDLLNFRLFTDGSQGEPQDLAKPTKLAEKNSLFISVRPDWRDSKSFLGYYNPLTCCYEWTPFLRFLLRAVQNHRSADAIAWFVILDEMNLARVEYYFADMLSVLESGRDSSGFTREPLRFDYPDEAEGDLPPHEVFLPPNLYFIGTVNVDETTHAFSPKVLDRAFSIELTETDFTHYPPQPPDENLTLTQSDRRELGKAFTRNGMYSLIDKTALAAYVAAHPELRNRLSQLNALLRPHNLHFGYRVFDEIVAFVAAAEANTLFADLTEAYGPDPAFDAAVLMKVLPKFHGSRNRLEAPLHALLAWCANPDAPDVAATKASFTQVDDIDSMLESLTERTYRFPQTAERACQMLRSLFSDGFAAFGG